MPGGFLNIVSYGNQNVILNGNPSKTFFKCAYAKHTNFGLQKFRIDFDGLRTLRMSESSHFTFKVPRYAELLMDTYLVVKLPTIWSPIVPPETELPEESEEEENVIPDDIYKYTWRPYEFKWIKNLGSQMIERVRFTVGGQVIQEFSGQYLYNLVERDFDNTKKDLYYKMTGNVAELNDPANTNGCVNVYPSVYPTTSSDYATLGPEPSIRARELYIPLNIWFTLASKMAFPLVSLQYSELHIEVDIRPVKELFVVRGVEGDGDYYHQPNLTNPLYQFYRFLQPPPDTSLTEASYTDRRTDWAADVHLLSTYAFLTNDEIRVFAEKEQKYLIKQAYHTDFFNVTGSKRIDLESLGMISNWMWFFQRSDVNLRNEWSNYSNWAYDHLPSKVISPSSGIAVPIFIDGNAVTPDNNLGGTSGIMITGNYSVANQKAIMMSWALLLDGKYRENELKSGVLEYVEKYTRTAGNAPDGLYCYNFGLNTSPFNFQPSGAINLSKFNNIQFEITTYVPPLDPDAQFLTICGPDGETIGVNKPNWRIYDYNYNLTVLEERYNILTFSSGNAGLMYAR
jgi:hypothetical protein